jgi:hypothetical protein
VSEGLTKGVAVVVGVLVAVTVGVVVIINSQTLSGNNPHPRIKSKVKARNTTGKPLENHFIISLMKVKFG